ncbi:hypothetical protein Tco_0815533 [Tanacetum coccineum]
MTCGTELTDGVCLQCCPYPNYYDNTPNYSDYPPQPEYQTYSCESCGNDAHYGYPCPSFVPDPCYKTPPVTSMEMLHAQTDLIEAMQDFLKKYDHIPHNEKSIKLLLAEERLQKANQALNESQSPQEMRIQDLEIQKQQCLEEMKEWMNDLGIREYRKEEIDIDYRRKCEDKIYELKDKFNGLSIEIQKIIQEAEELRKSEARARI